MLCVMNGVVITFQAIPIADHMVNKPARKGTSLSGIL